MRLNTQNSGARLASALIGLALAVSGGAAFSQVARPAAVAARPAPASDGVIRIRSAHSVDETAARAKAAVEAKGIRFFDIIDQSALARSADLPLGKSTLLLFGNPPLGVQFLQANRYAGLDWPVRMLIVEEADGSVWIAWTDFAWMGRRYALKDRGAQIRMATEVAATIASEAAQ